MDEILRHGTELGVDRFIPVLSRHCNRKPKERKDRWEKIVAGAVEQSGRPGLPRLDTPVPFKEFLAEVPRFLSAALLIASPRGSPVLRVLDDSPFFRTVILVGPEGGFTQAEETEAAEAGFVSAALGPGMLRTETAAITAVGIVAAWYGIRCTAGFRALRP